jgi:hypothetical protein
MSKNYVKEFLMDPTFILGEISNVKLGRGKAKYFSPKDPSFYIALRA